MFINRLIKNMLRSAVLIASFTLLLLLPAGAFCEPSDTVYLQNGITVNLYDPEMILEHLTERDSEGLLYFRPPGELLKYRLVEDINDEVIVNKGDGEFHPFNPTSIVQAFEAIEMGKAAIDCAIDVYILPYPRYYPLTSSSSGNRIFLSPGVYEMSSYVQAYTVTHEFGHSFQYVYMPEEDTEGWYQYLTMRGIYGDPNYSCTAEHMNRPKEIFAEDFRFLFGGDYATYSGAIENADLVVPSLVPGLESFMICLVTGDDAIDISRESADARELLVASNYPNPFNPVTVIRLRFSDAVSSGTHDIDLKIYSVDGRLVRDLYNGPVDGDQFSIAWNGTDDGGTPVASGLYFFRVRSDAGATSGKMLLMR